MQLIVFIGEEHEIYQFDKKQILVGSHPRCDIVLNYEGVGKAHLRFIEKDGEYFLQDLKSGFKTEVNQRVMKPGSAVKLNTVFPVEIGGVLLKLEDEETPVFDEESLFADSAGSLDSPVENDIISQINQKFEEQHGSEREKFKPNLYDGDPTPNATGSFKLSEAQIEGDSKSSLSKKVGSKKVNAKKSRKRLKQVNVRSNSQKFSLGSLVIISVILLAASWIFYTKHFNSPKKEVKQTVIEKDLILRPTKIDKIANQMDFLKSKIQIKGCEVKKEICLAINPEDFYQAAESIQYQGKTVNVLVRLDTLTRNAEILKPEPNDVLKAKKIVAEDYNDFFDIDAFENAEMKAPDIKFQYLVDDFNFHLLMIPRLLKPELLEIMEKDNLLDISVYGLEIDIDGKFEVTHYVNMPKQSLNYNIQRKADVLQEFRLAFNHALSLDLKENMKSIAATEFNEYDPSNAKSFIKGKKLDRFQEMAQIKKCKTSEEQQLCNQVKAYTSRDTDGVSIEDGDLIISLDTNSVFENFKDRYRENYSPEEFRGLINFFQKADTNGLSGWKNFKNDNFFVKNLRDGQINLAESIILLTDTQILQELKNNESLKNLVIVSYKESPDKLQVSLKIEKQKIPEMDELKQWTRVFWKNNLDLFTPYMKQNATELVVQ